MTSKRNKRAKSLGKRTSFDRRINKPLLFEKLEEQKLLAADLATFEDADLATINLLLFQADVAEGLSFEIQNNNEPDVVGS